jgi:hypothetical protein
MKKRSSFLITVLIINYVSTVLCILNNNINNNNNNNNTNFYKSLSLTQYCAGDKIEKNEMGGACSADGGGERRVQVFGGET